MAVAALRRLAAAAPAPVFAAVGCHATDRVADLFLPGDLERVSSPRHAAILLIAGDVPSDDHEALRRVHDQLLPPRTTLRWGDTPIPGFEGTASVAWDADPQSMLRTVYRQLVNGERASEPDQWPDQPPSPWRGVGEHGQGGKGMMGGTPYGRPMAMTADDLRDGLALDAFTVRIGPFLPVLPAGLVLELTLQGDVIQQARLLHPPYAQDEVAEEPEAAGRAGRTGVAAAASRLRRIAPLLELLELHAWALRARSLAQRPDGLDSATLDAVRKGVCRAGAFLALPKGLGLLESTAERTDVRARLLRWFDEAAEALQGEALAPRGASDPVPRVALEEALRGLEWNEAMLVLASFDPNRLRAGFTAPDLAELPA